MYRRKAIYEIDTAGSEENLEKLASVEMRHVERTRGAENDTTKDIERTTTTVSSVGSIPPKKSFVQELALYNGTFVDDPLWKMVGKFSRSCNTLVYVVIHCSDEHEVASVAILLNIG